jgi:hypothetical protein
LASALLTLSLAPLAIELGSSEDAAGKVHVLDPESGRFDLNVTAFSHTGALFSII